MCLLRSPTESSAHWYPTHRSCTCLLTCCSVARLQLGLCLVRHRSLGYECIQVHLFEPSVNLRWEDHSIFLVSGFILLSHVLHMTEITLELLIEVSRTVVVADD